MSVAGTRGATSIFDSDDETSGTYAIMPDAGPERAPVADNAFTYAVDLDDGMLTVGYGVMTARPSISRCSSRSATSLTCSRS